MTRTKASFPRLVVAAMAALLLVAGASALIRNGNGMTPLLLAINREGGVSTLKRLLDRGADPNTRDRNNDAALLLGTRNVDLVPALLPSGADVNARGNGSTTALMRSAAAGRADTATRAPAMRSGPKPVVTSQPFLSQ